MEQQTKDPATPGSRAFLYEEFEQVVQECRALIGAGQHEYAHLEAFAFANFERAAERRRAKFPDFAMEDALMIFFDKHLDGINAHLAGHVSQREPVEGRINDAIVYLVILRAMIRYRRQLAAKSSP